MRYLRIGSSVEPLLLLIKTKKRFDFALLEVKPFSFTFFGENMRIENTKIPLYGVFFFVGMFAAAVIAAILSKKKKIEFFDFLCAVVFVMIGAMVGAKLLFIIVSWKEIMRLHLSFLEIIRGGFVFYGGLIGGILAILLFGKTFKVKLADYVDVFACALPLGHAFGRVGCLFGGCCYGIEYDGFGHVCYCSAANVNTPLETPLFPVQLLEAFLLLCLFFVLLFLLLKGKARGKIVFVYAAIYAVLRFVLEFLRGDAERGVLWGISTSQWISLLLFAGAIFLLFYKKKEKKIE